MEPPCMVGAGALVWRHSVWWWGPTVWRGCMDAGGKSVITETSSIILLVIILNRC